MGLGPDAPIDTDVLVLGAGPAGCAAALHALRSGARVSMVEACASPKRKPGETLSPGMEPLFKSLGIEERIEQAGFMRHAGVDVVRDGVRSRNAYGTDASGPWRGYQVPRERFEAILIDEVIRAGGLVRRPERVRSLIMDGDRVVGATTDQRGIRARWTLDAMGDAHWMAGRLGLRVHRATERRTVRFGWNASGTDASEWPTLSVANNGWNWSAALGDGRTAWAHMNANGNGGGRDVTPRLVPQCAGDGYFLLGDAAMVLDPLSSKGVLKAFLSGMLASHLIGNGVRGACDASISARAYKGWMADFFRKEVDVLDRFYRGDGSSSMASATRHNRFTPPAS